MSVPELPEVEHVRRNLADLLEGRTIERVDVRLARIVRHPDVETFTAQMAGRRILGVKRRGKYLLIECEGDVVLVSHLRMEGRYGVAAAGEPLAPHTHVIFHLQDGRELRYRDVRQFGTMDLLTEEELRKFSVLAELGPEPLEEKFNIIYLERVVEGRRVPIKALLLDQRVLAGLGNIYVDEALFRAGIHPERLAGRLTSRDLVRLIAAIREVITEAIEAGGSSVKSYVNGLGQPGQFQASLRVYGRQGQSCVRCGAPIVKGRVAGRGTHVCLTCQPAPRTATIKRGSKA